MRWLEVMVTHMLTLKIVKNVLTNNRPKFANPLFLHTDLCVYKKALYLDLNKATARKLAIMNNQSKIKGTDRVREHEGQRASGSQTTLPVDQLHEDFYEDDSEEELTIEITDMITATLSKTGHTSAQSLSSAPRRPSKSRPDYYVEGEMTDMREMIEEKEKMKQLEPYYRRPEYLPLIKHQSASSPQDIDHILFQAPALGQGQDVKPSKQMTDEEFYKFLIETNTEAGYTPFTANIDRKIINRLHEGPLTAIGDFYLRCLEAEKHFIIKNANDPAHMAVHKTDGNFLDNDKYEMRIAPPISGCLAGCKMVINKCTPITKLITLEPITPERIVELHRLNHSVNKSDFSNDFYNYVMENCYLDPSKFRCAVSNGRMVGALVCRVFANAPTVLYIMNLVVAKRYQRCGVGTLLMSYAMDNCLYGAIYSSIQLHTQADNEVACNFYRRFKFIEKERLLDLYPDEDRDGVLLERRFRLQEFYEHLEKLKVNKYMVA
ncbi:hypothetical protein QR680_002995 [Steinernema hermaphroditum]|uniref:N-terminal methionine N(alpha)-acetyltransferase NatE n=1 Tax=Steinernema hermaphroditum TaxID=289476 RepID=A0AA39H539_9BILA|nr:hypothetical protein QR680_002995 [Steinernema hermaphroditum]